MQEHSPNISLLKYTQAYTAYEYRRVREVVTKGIESSITGSADYQKTIESVV